MQGRGGDPSGAVVKAVLFNVREGVSEADCLAMCARGRDLLEQIPGVERVSAGVAVEPEAPFRYCAVLRFRDAGVIAVYNAHPLHEAFLNEDWGPMVREAMVNHYRLAF